MNILRLRSLLAVVLLAAATTMLAQEIDRLDPAANKILPPSAKLEKAATGFDKWTEGPVWTHAGTLLFAEIPSNSILQWIPGKGASVFMHPSGY